MAETAVTFRCGHSGTLPVDAETASKTIAAQKSKPAWANLCPICRPNEDVGAGDQS